MPIYEYQCGACGHTLESFEKVSDDPMKDCPNCNKPKLQKLISAAGFQLKGTGWYATDFKNSGKPAKNNQPTEKDKKQGGNKSNESKSTTTETAVK